MGGVLALDPKMTQSWFGSVRSALHSFWYDKSISYNGLTVLNVEELEGLLPMERSSLWWKLNTSAIEAGLLRNPFIEKAVVTSCEGFMLGCFYVDITERAVDFLAVVGDKVWAVGKTGGFLMPLSKDSLWDRQRVFMRRSPTILQGFDGLSPDLVHARLEFLRRAVLLMEEKINHQVESVYFSRHDLEFLFRGANWRAVVDAPPENTQEVNLVRLDTQIQRLQRILDGLKGKPVPWSKIDLAFNRVAVGTP